MLVVHPKDITTSVLTSLYKGTDSKVVDQTASKREIEHLLHHCPPHERIMLLGHGSDNGLFSRTDDNVLEFDRIIVGHSHAYYLRHHGANMIGIWCHADKFARKEGLHGLFSGMIISDKKEAEEYGIGIKPTISKILWQSGRCIAGLWKGRRKKLFLQQMAMPTSRYLSPRSFPSNFC